MLFAFLLIAAGLNVFSYLAIATCASVGREGGVEVSTMVKVTPELFG